MKMTSSTSNNPKFGKSGNSLLIKDIRSGKHIPIFMIETINAVVSQVIWNPFDDIVPRAPTAKALVFSNDSGNRDTKRKASKKLNLLSFGEEAEEEEKELAAVKMKIRSSHDVLDDPRLLKEDGSTSKPVLVDF